MSRQLLATGTKLEDLQQIPTIIHRVSIPQRNTASLKAAYSHGWLFLVPGVASSPPWVPQTPLPHSNHMFPHTSYPDMITALLDGYFLCTPSSRISVVSTSAHYLTDLALGG
ncbi:hypothetical protein FOMG_19022 [Fusarium oxysporum f. sp. melonis 26406]|uniref:Uncharacterized protein n=1 Tax=Fusarium oxysporum f. sp. melonis 26406 TaxID=1089452 RepID=W9Z6K4_FUSOX|nr:hypothetical protein FOMG_19022 [Fusarium oxysporum f. sp. melonis 26406]